MRMAQQIQQFTFRETQKKKITNTFVGHSIRNLDIQFGSKMQPALYRLYIAFSVLAHTLFIVIKINLLNKFHLIEFHSL